MSRIKVLATLCYVKKGSRVLMLHRNTRQDDIHYGKWNGLGGKLEDGESPEECARREIREESGLEVSGLELRGVLSFPLFDGKKDWFAFVYLATSEEGSVINPEEGTLEWVEQEKILSLNLWPGDKIFLKWLFEKQEFFSGKFIYENKNLVDHSVSFYGSK